MMKIAILSILLTICVFIVLCFVSSIEAIKCVSCGTFKVSKEDGKEKVKIKSCEHPLPAPKDCGSDIKKCIKTKGKKGEVNYITRECGKKESIDKCEKTDFFGEMCYFVCSKDGCNSVDTKYPNLFVLIAGLFSVVLFSGKTLVL